ncbi:MAG: 30S ribosomal protein S19 [Candidatus Diapherotrites archaeon]
MAKEYTYMGKSIGELQQMKIEEFAKLTSARSRRSLERGVNAHLLEKITTIHTQIKEGKPQTKPIKTHLRQFVIMPIMVGLKMAVYKGNSFEQFEIQPEMMGHRLGEYVLTRKQVRHGKAGLGSTKSSSAVTAK